MRLLILSQYYQPEPIPKPVELAQELKQRGHSVSVLTGFPNYPVGRLYPGFRLAAMSRGEVDGIPVTRTFEFPYHGKHVIGRILNYASFMISAPLGVLSLPPCDVIYVWHPPLTVGVAAWLISRVRRVPFIYDVQDIWPESVVLSGLLQDGWIIRLISKLERFVYRRAHHILVVTAGARDNLVAKGVPPDKISVMPHWVDENLFIQKDRAAERKLRQELGWENRFVVMFAGNLGLVQGLETVISAAEKLEGNGNVLIALVGEGADKARLQELVRNQRLQHIVKFIPQQPKEKMPVLMAASDALLVHLKRSPLSNYVIPTKTLAYLAAGRPILMAMEGAAAQLVKEAQAGIVILPENPSELARAIHLIGKMPISERAAMGQRGQDYFIAHLSKEKVIPQYEAILLQLARSREN